jgi:hypothetical protein
MPVLVLTPLQRRAYAVLTTDWQPFANLSAYGAHWTYEDLYLSGLIERRKQPILRSGFRREGTIYEYRVKP